MGQGEGLAKSGHLWTDAGEGPGSKIGKICVLPYQFFHIMFNIFCFC